MASQATRLGKGSSVTVRDEHVDGDQKVWSWNKDESKVREAKSSNYFIIVH